MLLTPVPLTVNDLHPRPRLLAATAVTVLQALAGMLYKQESGWLCSAASVSPTPSLSLCVLH